MRQRKRRWLVVALVCLALWAVPAPAQETRWKEFMEAATEVYQESHYDEGEMLLLAALEET